MCPWGRDIKSAKDPKCRQYKKYCLLLFFSFCLSALQDVTGDDQTRLGAA